MAAAAIIAQLGVKFVLQLQLTQHVELAFPGIGGLLLILGFGCRLRDQFFGLECLELNRIGTCRRRRVHQAHRSFQTSVMIDARLGDDKNPAHAFLDSPAASGHDWLKRKG